MMGYIIYTVSVVVSYLLLEIVIRTVLKRDMLFLTDILVPIFGIITHTIIYFPLLFLFSPFYVLGMVFGPIAIVIISLTLTVVKAVLYYTPSNRVKIEKKVHRRKESQVNEHH